MKTFAAAVALVLLAACSDEETVQPIVPKAAAGSAGAPASTVGGSPIATAGAGGSVTAAGGSSAGSAGAAIVAGSGGANVAGAAGSGGAAIDPVAYAAAVAAADWTVLPNAPKLTDGNKQDDIFMFDAQHGFSISGEKGSIYETKDGGDTWSTVFTHKGTYFRSIVFNSPTHGFAGNVGVLSGAGTDTNVMYETKDAGVTWTPVTTITGDAPSGICNFTMIDADHIVAVGRVSGPSHFISTSDGGATWVSKSLATQFSMVIDAHFTSPTEGFVVGGTAKMPMKCTVLHTADGGDTWDTRFTSATANSLCWKVNFPSDNVGYVAVQDAGTGKPTFGKTTDGGLTWTELPLPGTKAYASIGVGFITDDIGWMAADDGTAPVYRTADGGTTWTVDTAMKAPINRFRFVDPWTGYASGASIWKLVIAKP